MFNPLLVQYNTKIQFKNPNYLLEKIHTDAEDTDDDLWIVHKENDLNDDQTSIVFIT